MLAALAAEARRLRVACTPFPRHRFRGDHMDTTTSDVERTGKGRSRLRGRTSDDTGDASEEEAASKDYLCVCLCGVRLSAIEGQRANFIGQTTLLLTITWLNLL